MKTLILLASIATAVALTSPARADEGEISLREGAGRDAVTTNCVMCHSLDYIQLNSRFLDRAGWEASVKKMINAFGAPIATEDAKAIVDYLAAQYGKQ